MWLRNQIHIKCINLAYSHICHKIFGRDLIVCEAAWTSDVRYIRVAWSELWWFHSCFEITLPCSYQYRTVRKNMSLLVSQKCRGHLKILDSRRVTRSKFHTEYPHFLSDLWTWLIWHLMLGACELTYILFVLGLANSSNHAENIRHKRVKFGRLGRATRCPEFVHRCVRICQPILLGAASYRCLMHRRHA